MSDQNYERAVDKAIESVKSIAERDRQFINEFGSWKRPDFAICYNLEKMKNLIVWIKYDQFTSIVDVAPFIKNLKEEDQFIAGEIAKFCLDDIKGLAATDHNLNKFRLLFIRRLDACGF